MNISELQDLICKFKSEFQSPHPADQITIVGISYPCVSKQSRKDHLYKALPLSEINEIAIEYETRGCRHIVVYKKIKTTTERWVPTIVPIKDC